MRILVTGTSTTFNTTAACTLLDTDVSWEVITSYQSALPKWELLPCVNSSRLFQDLKEHVPDETNGLVIEVVALSFFQKSWVKERLKTSQAPLVIVHTAPASCLDKSVLELFDQVYITKTQVADKQSQYYSTFLDSNRTDTKTETSFNEFKKQLRMLEVDQCLKIENESVQIVNLKVKKTQAISNSSTSGNGSKLPSSSIKLVSSSSEPVKCEVKQADKTMKESASKLQTTVEYCDKPSKITLSDDCTELWVNLTYAKGKNIDEVLTTFESILGNELITSMFSKTTYNKRPEDCTVCVYFQVFEQRRHLFVSLLSDMLLSLRQENIIHRGSIVF